MALTDRIRAAIVGATARARDADTLESAQEQLRERRRARERDRAERERDQREQRRGKQRTQAERERERQQRREAASEAVDEAAALAGTTRVGRGVSRAGGAASRVASSVRGASPGVRNVLEGAAERVDTDSVGVRSREDETLARAERAGQAPAVISDATLDPFGGEADPMTGPARLQMMVGGVGRPPRDHDPTVVDDSIVGVGGRESATMAGFVTGGGGEDGGDESGSMAAFVVGGEQR